MCIKKRLKDIYGISKTEFAKRIGVSRPTLNAYIQEFEEAGLIYNNPVVSELFEKIFPETVVSSRYFLETLDSSISKETNIVDTQIVNIEKDNYMVINADNLEILRTFSTQDQCIKYIENRFQRSGNNLVVSKLVSRHRRSIKIDSEIIED